jgi:hypothetical protein
MPVENLCGQGVGEGFPQLQNGISRLFAGPPNQRRRAHAAATSTPGEQAAPSILAGYDSPVCSMTGDAIDRIAAAIDQLASDVQDASTEPSEDELTTRIAALWQMVSDLDPELARRARRYAGPADGGPSA